MKKILIISQYFYNYNEYGNTRFYEIARLIFERKHRVKVLTSNTDFSTGLPKKNQYYNYSFDVVQFKLFLKGKSFLYRLISYLEFFLKSFLYDFKNYDYIYASSPSVFTGLSGSIRKLLSKTCLIYEIRDPWPESFDRLKVSNIIKRLIYKIDYFNCKQADYIICLTPGIARIIKNRNPDWNNKIVVIPNGVKESKEKRNIPQTIQNKTRVVFSGTITEHSGVDKFLMLDEIKEKNFIIDIYGKGQYLEQFLELIKDKSYINYKGHLSKKNLTQTLEKYEVGFTYSPEGIYRDIAYGTKLFDYLASDLYILAFNNKNGDIGKLLTEYGNGEVVENDEEFFQFFADLSPSEIARKRSYSRKLLNDNFIFSKNFNEFLDYLKL